MTRVVVLALALVFVTGFGVLTIAAAAEQGVSLATLISVFIVVLLGIGILSALRNPPRE